MILKKILLLGIIFTTTLVISNWYVSPDILIYIQSIQLAVIGYLFVEIIATSSFKLSEARQQKLDIAKSIRSIIRIMGSIIIAAIVISYLSQNTAIAASIGTISALVIGFASQNLLGNIIAGMYLALTRPFKIGDVISVFGNTGTVTDIKLLNCELLTKEGDILRVPSSSMLTTPVVIKKSNNVDFANTQSNV